MANPRRWAFDSDDWVFLGVEGPLQPHNGKHEVCMMRLDGASHNAVRSQLDPSLRDADAAARLVADGYVTRAVVTQATPGVYHPRMSRPWFSPDPYSTPNERVMIQSVHAARNIFRRLRDILRTVEPDCATAYGHNIRDLLILACTEVESSMRAVLVANDYLTVKKLRERDLKMDHYRDLAAPMRLADWSVKLAFHPDYPPVVPFKGWLGAPDESIEWYSKHHLVKHGREANFAEATLQRAIAACAGVYVMLCAQFGQYRKRHNYDHEFPVQDVTGWADDDFLVEDRPKFADLHYWPPHIPFDPYNPAPSRVNWHPVPFWPRP